MTFRHANDLLVYLQLLADSDRHGALLTGQMLVDAMLADERIEHSTNDYDAIARMLWALRDEGSVRFKDWTETQRGPYQTPGYNDLVQAANIEVTGPGRAAVGGSRPQISINQLVLGNVSKVDLIVLLSAIEQEVDSLSAPVEERAEAKSRLKALREAAQTTATGAAGNVIGAAVRQFLGLGP